ncbi:class I SAM-dependent methyltransferase [Alteromonas stellipolaris]|uniref:class I SAM-dependent methyltransferase n=1 Tax=Alteromonas stellipolaris TaxID=233316 RepID=UPI00273622BC|nr:class I SAM-dependent methyltransferase [Alteromonas stellipolaris]MDP2535420.1 class I SAM-dependent methyltransferase [Alteromonas stellipolaris]MDP2596713.1 class I SAM-dependent methyltransferase [Alteromonas stellipolaris]
MLSTLPLVIASTEIDANFESDKALALTISGNWGFPIDEKPVEGFYLQVNDNVLGLADANEKKTLPVVVDFASPASLYRKAHGGGRKEPIVKAIGFKGNTLKSTDFKNTDLKSTGPWHVVDATPGLGRDAFVLISVGCKVTMIERSPIVAALLEDGIRRLKTAYPELADRFALQHGNSANVMQYWNGENVDAIYLDPMFPHKKKSALVKKEMRLFQQLLGHDPDADALLAPALALASSRVVVKRPNSAAVLAGNNPSMAIESKKHRFDVYLRQKS